MSEATLIDGYTFFTSDDRGRLDGTGGLYHRDTRYLSSLDVTVDGDDLAVLATERARPWRRRVLHADLASGVNRITDSAAQKHTALVAIREQTVRENLGLVERWQLRNYDASPWSGTVSVSFCADFADIFEVRGIEGGIDRDVGRDREERAVRYEYEFSDGGDQSRYETTVTFCDAFERFELGSDAESNTESGGVPESSDDPESGDDLESDSNPEWGGDPSTATATLEIGPGDATTVAFAAEPGPSSGGEISHLADAGRSEPYPRPVAEVIDALDRAESPHASTFRQCARDLGALVTDTEWGSVPLAGVPWFATQFGRDMLVTAYATLPVWPELARGTLRFLAAYQGTTTDETRAEEPGKIFHELRRGELAARGRIRHTPYYATVDATPLWIVLCHEAYRWLGDEDLLADLRPNVEAALDWLAAATDRGPDDPFVYYDRPDATGLEHTAWKDTAFAVQFADGERADTPIASVEVQGYAYDALRRSSELARAWGDDAAADRYARRAERLRTAFEETFWLPDREFYGAAKTADGRVVDTKTSNVGHCLWSGVVAPGRADAVAAGLTDDDLFSKWGVRTLSTDAAGYSPVSYHAGGVWPHDNAFVALGLARYGHHDAAERVARAILDAGRQFDGSLPELFCGFDEAYPPVRYPAACEPQAWSAATPFALLRALFALGPGEPGGKARAGNVPAGFPAAALRPVLAAWRTGD